MQVRTAILCSAGAMTLLTGFSMLQPGGFSITARARPAEEMKLRTNTQSSKLASVVMRDYDPQPIHPVDTTPDGKHLLRLDTSHGTLEISVVNTASAGAKRILKVGVTPVTVRAASNNEAWVLDEVADSISIVDINNGVVTGALQTEAEPTDVRFDDSPPRAYVSVARGTMVLPR